MCVCNGSRALVGAYTGLELVEVPEEHGLGMLSPFAMDGPEKVEDKLDWH
jgi:hypothetical protein